MRQHNFLKPISRKTVATKVAKCLWTMSRAILCRLEKFPNLGISSSSCKAPRQGLHSRPAGPKQSATTHANIFRRRRDRGKGTDGGDSGGRGSGKALWADGTNGANLKKGWRILLWPFLFCLFFRDVGWVGCGCGGCAELARRRGGGVLEAQVFTYQCASKQYTVPATYRIDMT